MTKLQIDGTTDVLQIDGTTDELKIDGSQDLDALSVAGVGGVPGILQQAQDGLDEDIVEPEDVAPIFIEGPITFQIPSATNESELEQPGLTPGDVGIDPSSAQNAATIEQPVLSVADIPLSPGPVTNPSKVGEHEVTLFGGGDQQVFALSAQNFSQAGQPAVTPGAVEVLPQPVSSESYVGRVERLTGGLNPCNAHVTYSGDGMETSYSIDFPYLEVAHVIVTVDGATVAHSISGNQVIFTSPPAFGSLIDIRRETPHDELRRGWHDSAPIRHEDLIQNDLQILYYLEEVADAVSTC